MRSVRGFAPLTPYLSHIPGSVPDVYMLSVIISPSSNNIRRVCSNIHYTLNPFYSHIDRIYLEMAGAEAGLQQVAGLIMSAD